MFSSTELFKGVQCPQGTNCLLLRCIFSHIELAEQTKKQAPVATVAYDPTSAGEPEIPPSKRRRLSPLSDKAISDREAARLKPATQSIAFTKDGDASDIPKPKSALATREQVYRSSAKPRDSLASIQRTVSPPPRRQGIRLGESQTENGPTAQNNTDRAARLVNLPKENLTPRLLTPNPAPHPVRLAVLKKIHEQITRLNDEALRDQGTKKELVLSETEVITIALDEEEKMGKENPQIYKNVVGHRIQRLKKMKLEEWKSSVLVEFEKKYLPPKSPPAPKLNTVETGLTAEQEIAVLAHIITTLKGLETYGYVTTAPTAPEIKVAEDGVRTSKGFERCDRCGTRFRVFPGRNSDETSKFFGRLTSTENGCTYHWAKPFRPPRSSTGAGEQESYYMCCRGAIGSKGCTHTSDHVFKASEVKRMASFLQFESTPWPDDRKRPRGPVTFDCEMGYTTLGMELIRLTAISWPQNKPLLDILVRPIGEVIDYNTRFSGISQEHFSNGLPYAADTSKPPPQDTQPEQPPLPIVNSPQTARKLLFQHLTPLTALLGHAIENDLNTCRIIHPTIVDTVLLFPHPRGLPVRHGLKMLAAKHLQRSIQAAGALGHDSREDAVATADLVRLKVGEKWKRLKLQGWTFREAELVEPPGLLAGEMSQVVKAGVKRPASLLDEGVEEGGSREAEESSIQPRL
jgi:DNA polymerase III epsilon subunit-like protein